MPQILEIFLPIWAGFTAFAGLVMALARTGPAEARSNLSKWIAVIGVERIPNWLEAKSGDRIVFRWASRAMAALVGTAFGFIIGCLAEPFAKPPEEPWNEDLSPGAHQGPLGPITAIEFTQTFNVLPKPCQIRLTSPPNSELASTFGWLLQYGGPKNDVICEVNYVAGPQDVDEVDPPITKEPGLVVHWDSSFLPGEKIAHFFDADGFNVRYSHRLPPHSPQNLIWIDIGPGSPWKVATP